jgi:hypothetical protein
VLTRALAPKMKNATQSVVLNPMRSVASPIFFQLAQPVVATRGSY